MTDPTITCIIPTVDENRPLARALWSVVGQLEPGDEVIVVSDTHDGPLPHAEAICTRLSGQGYAVRYLAHDAGGHDWGHAQIEHGMAQAHGSLLHVSDDDDIWASDALDHMREAARTHPGRPLLVRFLNAFGNVYWERPGRVARNHLGGHCLVAPNVPGKLPRWGHGYTGDFDAIRSCLDAHGGDDAAVWVDAFVAYARPMAHLSEHL